MTADRLAYFWNIITGRTTFYTFQWHIIDRCNLSCSHCYQEHAAEDPDQEKLQRVLEQIRAFLRFQEKVQQRPVFGRIVLAGGEPFLRNDFFALIGKIKNDLPKIRFAILTNGTRIDASTAAKLSKLRPDFIQVSLEGSQSINDDIRGEGSFQQTTTGLGIMVRKKIRILISFTAHKKNFMHFQDVVKTGCRIGVNKVWADRLVPLGHGRQLETLDSFETQSFFKQMLKARQWAMQNRCKTTIAFHRALQFLAGGGTPYHCKAGDTLITIMPDGTVLPCRRMPVVIGNLYQRPLVDIYHSSPFLKTLRNKKLVPEGCQGCDYIRTCRGGARCLSFAAYKNLFAADPGCWLSEFQQTKKSR